MVHGAADAILSAGISAGYGPASAIAAESGAIYLAASPEPSKLLSCICWLSKSILPSESNPDGIYAVSVSIDGISRMVYSKSLSARLSSDMLIRVGGAGGVGADVSGFRYMATLAPAMVPSERDISISPSDTLAGASPTLSACKVIYITESGLPC